MRACYLKTAIEAVNLFDEFHAYFLKKVEEATLEAEKVKVRHWFKEISLVDRWKQKDLKVVKELIANDYLDIPEDLLRDARSPLMRDRLSRQITDCRKDPVLILEDNLAGFIDWCEDTVKHNIYIIRKYNEKL